MIVLTTDFRLPTDSGKRVSSIDYQYSLWGSGIRGSSLTWVPWNTTKHHWKGPEQNSIKAWVQTNAIKHMLIGPEPIFVEIVHMYLDVGPMCCMSMLSNCIAMLIYWLWNCTFVGPTCWEFNMLIHLDFKGRIYSCYAAQLLCSSWAQECSTLFCQKLFKHTKCTSNHMLSPASGSLYRWDKAQLLCSSWALRRRPTPNS